MIILLLAFFSVFLPFDVSADAGGESGGAADPAERPLRVYPQELLLVVARTGDGKTVVDVLRDASRWGSLAVPSPGALHDAIAETGEYTVNYPSADMEEIVRYLLSAAEPDMDMLEELGLELSEADRIVAPFVKGSVRSYENNVRETLEFGNAAFFVGATLRVHETSDEKAERLYLAGENREMQFVAVPAYRHYPIRIALIVAGDVEEESNAMVVGMCLIVSEDPFIVAVWIGKTRYTYPFIERNMEFVYSIPAEDMKREVIVCGTQSGRDIDKFDVLKLDTLPPSAVRAPVLGKAVVNYECEVIETLDAGSHTVFIGREKAAHRTRMEKRPLLYFGGPQDVEDNYNPLPIPTRSGRADGNAGNEVR